MADYYTYHSEGIALGLTSYVGYNFGKYKKLFIDGNTSGSTAKVGICKGIGPNTFTALDDEDYNMEQHFTSGKFVTLSTTRQIYEIDISDIGSGLSDQCTILVLSPKGTYCTYVYNIWLE